MLLRGARGASGGVGSSSGAGCGFVNLRLARETMEIEYEHRKAQGETRVKVAVDPKVDRTAARVVAVVVMQVVLRALDVDGGDVVALLQALRSALPA